MIESLTEEQVAKFPEYVDFWVNIGMNTEPVNFEKAKEAVIMAYEAAELSPPTQFYVVDSPMAAIDFIRKMDSTQTPLEILNGMIFGNHETWLSFYHYIQQELHIKECDKLNGLIELSKHCGWLNVYEDVVVFQHRPEIIKLDDQNRLHNDNGPAIRYRDGFSIYCWHGVRIPAEWIEDKNSLTPQMALTWENIEQRRAACEILGWVNILKQLNARVIDEDADPEIGVLVEVDIPEIGKERFLKVLCGTKREFALPVPPDMQTALQANAWTYDVPEDFLKQIEFRT